MTATTSQLTRLHRAPHNTGRRLSRKPCLEVLEDRTAPAILNVNSVADTVAVNLSTGQDAAGNISLRSALMAANNLGGSNTINLPSSVYRLTLSGANEDNAATGDLDIQTNRRGRWPRG